MEKCIFWAPNVLLSLHQRGKVPLAPNSGQTAVVFQGKTAKLQWCSKSLTVWTVLHGFYGINMSHFIRDWKLPWQTSDSFSVEEDKE